MIIVEQIVCWAFAILLIAVALRFLVKEKLSFALVLCLCAVGFAFFGLSGVQGLLKTGLLLTVKDSLVKYGDKLEGFQTNVASMRAELAEHQTLIDKHQKELTDQQATIRLAHTQLLEQQKRLVDVQFLVTNLFGKVTYENIACSDTNRCCKEQLTNGDWRVFVKLKYAAIPRSLQASVNALFWPQSFPNPIPGFFGDYSG